MSIDSTDIKITVERGKEKIELTVPSDSGIEDWENVFRVVLKWITFTEETINEIFNKEL